jgi:staphyloferrin B biosynthesis citrate synthase
VDASSLKNPVIERMRAGDVSLGMIVRLARSGDVARIAKTTGHDFIFIDRQHSLFSLETVGHIAQAALGCGVAPLVRVRSCHDGDTSVILDNGATGIIFPDVNSAADAKAAVDACKFAPVGKRSVSAGYPVFDLKPVPLAESVPALNATTLVVCMIETVEGLANVEEIAAVDGVDVLHVGCNDLLADMGKPGTFGSPEMIAAVEKVMAAAKANGKFAGLGGDRDIERQARFIRGGVQFVTTQSDIAFLMAEASRRTGTLREAIAKSRSA